METNTNPHNAQATIALTAPVGSDVGSWVFADLFRKLSITDKEEQEEHERHQLTLQSIQAERRKIEAGIGALQIIYPDYYQAAIAEKHLGGNDNSENTNPSVEQEIRSEKVKEQSKEHPSGWKKNSVFARGELRESIIYVINKEGTFLSTEEVASKVRRLFPGREFDNKLITEGLKDARKKGAIIGQPALRGRFLIILNGLPEFFTNIEQGTLKLNHKQKLQAKVAELGLTLVDTQETGNISSKPIEVTSADVEHAQEVLRRPKSSLKLF
jgi:hypothetical protein